MFSKASSKSKTAKNNKGAAQPATPSIMSADLTVDGDIVSDGEVQIDGKVDGDVKCLKLTVGQTGSINGSVTAERALIRGKVNGQIEANTVTLTRTSRVKGDILHETLMIEPGAHLEGHCRRMDNVTVTAAAPAQIEQKPAETKINLIVNEGSPARVGA